MADSTTFTKYLKLKLAADLSADARYNLQRIDSLGSTFTTDNSASLLIQSLRNITLETEAPSIGGTGNGQGYIYLGTADNKSNIVLYSSSVQSKSPLSIANGTSTYLTLASIQDQLANYTLTFDTSGANKSISFPLDGNVVVTSGAQSLTDKGIDADVNTLTNIRNSNIASNAAIAYSKLDLSNSIVNGDISTAAAIADTKLATISTAGKVANSATTATSINTPSAIVARDGSGNFSAGAITMTGATISGLTATRVVATNSSKGLTTLTYSVSNSASSLVQRDSSGNFSAGTITATFIGNLTGNVTGNVSGTAGNITATSNSTLTTLSSLSLPGAQVTGDISGNANNITDTSNSTLTSLPNLSLPVGQLSGILPVTSGGTGANTAASAMVNLLPSYTSNNNKVLGLNSGGTALEWKNAGTGIVDTISVSSPLVINNSIPSLPAISIPQSNTTTDGYLSFTDWTTFNNKQAAITGGASTITSTNLTINRALLSNGSGKVAVSSVTSTELGYLSGVTSAIQTQLNGKEPTITAGTTSQYWRGDKTWYSPVINSTAGSETDQAASVAAMKSYVASAGGGATAYTWATVDGATKSITHSLNKTTVSVTIYDENGEDILVDTVDRTSSNAVTLTSSTAPTGNWTVVIRP